MPSKGIGWLYISDRIIIYIKTKNNVKAIPGDKAEQNEKNWKTKVPEAERKNGKLGKRKTTEIKRKATRSDKAEQNEKIWKTEVLEVEKNKTQK